MSDDPDAVAADDASGEIPHHGAVAVGLRNPLRHHDQAAGQFRLGGFQLHLAHGGALFLVLLAQRMQVAQPLLVPLAPPGHAVAHPVFLHEDFPPDLVPLQFLLFQDLIAPGFELGKPLVQHTCGAAIQPDGGSGNPFQQAAVMADHHDAGAHAGEFLLQPLDAGKVEMVGGLIQQQDVGFGGEDAGEGGAAGLAARQHRWVFAAGQTELLEEIGGAVVVGGGGVAQAGFDVLQCGGEPGEIGLLRQIADGGAWLGESAAGILLHQAGGDPQ